MSRKCSSNGLIAHCASSGCGFKCCSFGSDGHIVILPGELAGRNDIDHLRCIGYNFMGAEKVKCEAKECSTCDGGYKPIMCRSYPLWVKSVGNGKVMRSQKCPLPSNVLADHREYVLEMFRDYERDVFPALDVFLSKVWVDKYDVLEEWRQVSGYEGYYEVSNLGRVRSIARTVLRNGKVEHSIPEKVLKPRCVTKGKYLAVSLCKNHRVRNFMIHSLVAQEFLGYVSDRKYAVVNHIDNNSHNNRLGNLEIVSNRENSSCHKYMMVGKASKYVGVSSGKYGRWQAHIRFDGVQHYLGTFATEELAKDAYDKKLEELKCGARR